MKERIEVSAPGKLMLFGEHAVMYGKPCIVTAVDQRMKLMATPQSERKFNIDAPEVGVIGYEKTLDEIGILGTGPKGSRFVETAIKVFGKHFNFPFGVKIKTTSEFQTSGLGSSSASAACTISALSELLGKRLGKKELFDLSYETVLEVQKAGSGFDVAAVVWGGTLLYLYGGKKIEPLKVSELNLVIGHSGVKAETPQMVRKVEEKRKRNKGLMDDIFKLMGEVTNEARRALERGDMKMVGELANINQGLLEAIDVSSFELSKIIYAARNAGAYGAKLSGAGGGDCMIAFVNSDSRKNVEKAIEEAGGKVIKVGVNAEGIKLDT